MSTYHETHIELKTFSPLHFLPAHRKYSPGRVKCSRRKKKYGFGELSLVTFVTEYSKMMEQTVAQIVPNMSSNSVSPAHTHYSRAFFGCLYCC
jgi:hypothetical protein